MQIQTEYAKRVYQTHMNELEKLQEMSMNMARGMAKPMDQASKRGR
jgi:hypothetical protein